MNELTQSPIRDLIPAESPDLHDKVVPLLAPLRKDVASIGPPWFPLALVLGAIVGIAYVDHLVLSTSLVYLYIFPLGAGAILLRKEISYSLIPLCILFHDYWSPRIVHPMLRIFDNLLALLCFSFVVYFIQRYIEQRELLGKTIQQQRDDLLQDVKLAAQVQRLFLPVGKPAIDGLEIADVAGKGVPAALLMSATAAAMRLEANRDRNMLEQVDRLNTEIGALSDPERYVSLLVAEIDTHKRIIRYVNCGHNPALLFRAKTGALIRMDSSCPPIGLSPDEICELATADLASGDALVFYTDGITEAENGLGEEFGLERLSAVVRDGSSQSAEDLMTNVYNAAADFCGDDFHDDVTILVVKCNFEVSSTVGS